MGEHVQHPRPPRQPRGKGMVRALVIEEARLLPPRHIRHVNRAIHRHRHRALHAAAQHRRLFRQPFQTPRPARPVLDDRHHPRHRPQGRDQRLQQHLGPCRIGLNHRHIPETVDHNARQTIRLGMHQPVKGRVEQPLPQRLRPCQTRGKPRLIHHRRRVTVQHPRYDLRFHIDGDKAEGPPLAILQHAQRAGRDVARPPVHDQLIGIDPRETMADRPRLGLGLQPHHGKAARGGPIIGK